MLKYAVLQWKRSWIIDDPCESIVGIPESVQLMTKSGRDREVCNVFPVVFRMSRQVESSVCRRWVFECQNAALVPKNVLWCCFDRPHWSELVWWPEYHTRPLSLTRMLTIPRRLDSTWVVFRLDVTRNDWRQCFSLALVVLGFLCRVCRYFHCNLYLRAYKCVSAWAGAVVARQWIICHLDNSGPVPTESCNASALLSGQNCPCTPEKFSSSRCAHLNWQRREWTSYKMFK